MRRFFVLVLVGLSLGSAAVAWGQSFSIDVGSPEITVGVSGSVGPGGLQPGEIFIPLAAFGAVAPPVAPPALTSLIVISPGEVDGLSFGRRPPSVFIGNEPVVFSLDRSSSGLAGTASANEFNFGSGVSEQSSDLFLSTFNATNTLFADGDGVVQAGNPNPAAFPLGAGEFATFPFPPGPPPPLGGADLDAVDLRANLFGPGSPTGRVFYSLDASSASAIGFSGGDVLVDPTGLGNPASVYASEMLLEILPIGAPPGSNDIDALVVYDDGDNVFSPGGGLVSPGDFVLFSLAPGSAYLGQLDPITGLAIEAGDILMDGPSARALLGTATVGAAIFHTAESLGLRTVRQGFPSSDNLDALDVVPEPVSVLQLLLGVAVVCCRRRQIAPRVPLTH